MFDNDFYFSFPCLLRLISWPIINPFVWKQIWINGQDIKISVKDKDTKGKQKSIHKQPTNHFHHTLCTTGVTKVTCDVVISVRLWFLLT